MRHRRKEPDQHLPLPGAEFQILLALADDDRHGYAIMTEVEARTGGKVALGPGTLYGAVKRMLAAGLIEERAGHSAGDDERRRYYRLTSLGRAVATAEARRLAELVRQAREKRLLGRLETA